jgi:hypothetical protein
MSATELSEEHEGITGVTFDSDGRRLLPAPTQLRDLIAGWLAGIHDCEPAGRYA